MPAVPLAYAHAALVDALVERIEGRDGLDDVVVVLVHAELDLCAGVGVAHTQLGATQVAVLQALKELLGVDTDTAEQFCDNVGGLAGLALDALKGGADLAGQFLVLYAEDDLRLVSASLRTANATI